MALRVPVRSLSGCLTAANAHGFFRDSLARGVHPYGFDLGEHVQIQDTLDPEYYPGAFCQDGHWKTTKFSDVADVPMLSEADMQATPSALQQS
jgi:hypothetical protein